MRILLVSHNVIRGDGQGRVNLEIAKHCLAKGHGVDLLARRVDSEITAAGAKWRPISPQIGRSGVLHHWDFVRQANRQVSRLRPIIDVIVANGYTLTAPHDVNLSHFVHYAWRRHRANSYERWPRSWYHKFDTRCNETLERKSYVAADVVVGVSRRVHDELMSAGLPDRKLRVIYNGVDPNELHPGVEDRTDLGLPVGVPLGIFVGDLRTYRKNLDTVLKALVRAPSVHFAVVGTVDKSPFPKIASSLGVANRVHFLGFRRDVARIMRACTFLAFPTRYEPFGLAILEALSSGLPVITTRRAGAAELMNEDCGILLDDPEDVEVLASAMIRLSAPDVCFRAGLAARQVAESYSWTDMADRYLDLFKEIYQGRYSTGEP